MDKTKNKKRVYQRRTIHVRIDSSIYELLRLKAKGQGMSVKDLLGEYLGELLAIDNGK